VWNNLQFKPNVPKDMWLNVQKDLKAHEEAIDLCGQLHVIIVYNKYSKEKIAGEGDDVISTHEMKVYDQQALAEKLNPDSVVDAPNHQTGV
jgi:hypothetical protein